MNAFARFSLVASVIGLLHCGGTQTPDIGGQAENQGPSAPLLNPPAASQGETKAPSTSGDHAGPSVDDAHPDTSTAPATPSAASVVPKLFVRGFGAGSDMLIGSARHFDEYKAFFAIDGIDAKDTYDLGDYNDSGSTADMTLEIGNKLETIMNTYPAGTKFDVFGHSLGGIVALRGILEKNLQDRVRTFVALASPIYGQDQEPINCMLGIRCGDIYKTYRPFQSADLMAYMKKNDAKLHAMKLCSQISPDDGIVTAPMAGGQFPDGVNVVTPKVAHMQIIKSATAYKALIDQCFGGTP